MPIWERYRDSHSITLAEFIQDFIVYELNQKFSGSGIDAGYKCGKISKKHIYIESSYHCMNEHGYYDGWQEFSIRIPITTDWHDWKLLFRYDHYKADKYMLREYLEDSLHFHLSEIFESSNFINEN